MSLRRLKPYQSPAVTLPPCPPDALGKTVKLLGHLQSRNYSCGFAAALTVIRKFKPDVDPFELFAKLGTGRDGTRQNSIVRELRASGVSANVRYDVDFARVRAEIERDKPIIAYLFDHEHWLVVYGYARNPDRVFVCDPRPGEASIRLWDGYGERLGKFGIICSAARERQSEQAAIEHLSSMTSNTEAAAETDPSETPSEPKDPQLSLF